ncbi:hypothetical protein MBRA_06277 [Methylobacterium brachiatum]|nr:hypothetical protein MBRA_06277 [Methylobacterium brachiatum]
MLQFESNWRFTSPGPVPLSVVHAFSEFIDKIAQQGDAWPIVEKFKFYFSGGGGYSSSLSWARSDMTDRMHDAAKNAPLFIEAFWKGCNDCASSGLHVPDVALINATLAEHKAGYEIRPPYLVATQDYTPIAVPQHTPSLDAQAKPLIEEALAASERFLNEGKGRAAVSEILWLLETIATAFRGTGTGDESVQGKYFNAIVKELKGSHRGKAQEQILTWMTTLHRYLSSPTGGGVRHGTDLKEGIAMQTHEARLYCNLIRSYITFLIQEHERQTAVATV